MLIDDELIITEDDLFLMLMEDEWLDSQLIQLMVPMEDEFPNVPLEWL